MWARGLAAAVSAVLLCGASPASGAVGIARPDLGPPAGSVRLLGAAPDGAAGEAWAIGELADGQRVYDGDRELALPATRPVVLLRHVDASGWYVAQPLQDALGAPLSLPLSSIKAARVSAQGQVALLAVDRGSARILAGDAAAGVRELPDPGTALQAGESLATADRAVIATGADPAGSAVYVPAIGDGLTREVAVLRYAAGTWKREPIAGPVTGSFKVTAMAVAPDGTAWLAARATDRGIALYQREPDGVWRARSLGAHPLAGRDPGQGILNVQPLDTSPAAPALTTSPLTATNAGVWADGRLDESGSARTFTLFYNAAARQVSRTFCAAKVLSGDPFCDQPLGAELARRSGYASAAWAGDGLGTRVITDPDGDSAPNRGAYLSYVDGQFQRNAGAGAAASDPRGGAFLGVDRGWLGGGGQVGADGGIGNAGIGAGVTEILPSTGNPRLESWPVSLREPLTAVTPAPNGARGALDSGALAVGVNGAIARYNPATGWEPESLLDSNGLRSRPRLRGVAWPEPSRAHAVGDNGEMWVWQGATGLWERDEAAPPDIDVNFMGIAFQQGQPDRGYAIGRRGAILRYDKTWTRETVPADDAKVDLTSIAFAGSQALVAAGKDVLVNDGGGWSADPQVRDLLKEVPAGTITSVAGLPDGGAVAAGKQVVLVRDGRGAPWRFTSQPLAPDLTAVAAAAIREGDRVRAVLSVTTAAYPDVSNDVPIDDTVQFPVVPSLALPKAGFILRETAGGWQDEEHAAYRPSSSDLPLRPDPILAFALDTTGNGWTVGGETGAAFTSAEGNRIRTAGIYRYPPSGAAPPGAGAAVPNLSADKVRLAVGGDASCRQACADLGTQQLGPDVTLVAARQRADELARAPGGPSAFLYTGGRLRAGTLDGAEATRYAQLAVPGGLPFYGAVERADSAGGAATGFSSGFGGAPTPFGLGALPAAASVDGIPGAGGEDGARTHYAVDMRAPGGTVRVVFIDNSAGSLDASDGYQNPRERQIDWLRDVLRGARAAGVPAIVVGSRDLNTAVRPQINVATDADEVAQLLVDEGASAYFFDRPNENRQYRIPAGAPTANSIPTFGTGTLGYGPDTQPTPSFSDSGILLAEIDARARDARTNRAPVTVSLVPVIGELSVDSVDGTLLRRSRTALFTALARRPRGGMTTFQSTIVGDPYVTVPADICTGPSCSQRIDPAVRFTSSRPDIGDFVKRDPNSTSLRAVLLGADDKPISDATSPLFCAFNAGTTTVTVQTGNLTFSQQITVQTGTAQRPCGTRPLQNPPATTASTPSIQTPNVEPDAATQPPLPDIPVPVPALATPPAPAPVSPPTPAPSPSPPSLPSLPNLPTLLPPTVAAATFIPVIPPPPVQPLPRPTPPSGTASVRVFEEEREEEEAYEQSSAYARYDVRERHVSPIPVLALVLLTAAAGAGVGRRRRTRRPPAFQRSDGR